MNNKTLFNGERTGEWAQSRGLLYGDGVFRTLLVWDSKILNLSLHLQKLEHDSRKLDLQIPNLALLESELRHLSQNCERGVLRVTLTRQCEGRGYAPRTSQSDRLLSLHTAPTYPVTHWEQGIHAIRSPIDLASQPALAGIKHLNRLEQVLASRDWPEQVSEAIQCNQSGEPICGTRSNLFIVRNQSLLTPKLDQSGVAGVQRDRVIATAQAHKLKVSVEPFSWDTLLNADEAFICNSLIGIWPIRILEQRQWPTVGAVTRLLQQTLNQPRLSA